METEDGVVHNDSKNLIYVEMHLSVPRCSESLSSLMPDFKGEIVSMKFSTLSGQGEFLVHGRSISDAIDITETAIGASITSINSYTIKTEREQLAAMENQLGTKLTIRNIRP